MTAPRCVIAKSDAEIMACLPILHELRPHLEEATFVAQVRRQERHGFALMVLLASGQVVGVAGFRISECLGCATYMYIDDLVVTSHAGRQGYGKQLLQELIHRARANDCTHLMLDSAMHREASHELYRKFKMIEMCRHFELALR